MHLDLDSLLAGGNDNWRHQLRDHYGRWIFMGGLGRFFGRSNDGKILSAIGEIVGIPSEKAAVLRVSEPRPGVKAGDYLVPAKNISRTVAVLSDDTLKKNGINPPQIRDQAGIPKFDEMESAAAALAPSIPQSTPSRPFLAGREGTSTSDTPLSREGWTLIDNGSYTDARAQAVLDLQVDRLLSGASSNPSIASILADYKNKYGGDWLPKLKSDFKQEHENLIKDLRDRYSKVDLYQRGSVTVAIDKDFRDLPNSFDEIMLSLEKLHDNTRHGGTPLEVVISGDDSGFDTVFGRTSFGSVVFAPENNNPTGNLITHASMLINAGFLKPEHRDKFIAEELTSNMKKLGKGDQTHFNPAAYEGTPEDFLQYIIAHEWGHHLDYAAKRDENGKPIKTEFDFNGEQSHGFTLSSAIAAAINSNPWLLAELSKYSSENPREVLAELFAQVFMEEHFGASISGIPTPLKNMIRRLALSLRK